MTLAQADRPLTLRCLNPTCSNTCTFRPTGSGRQPTFCSNRCRAKYGRMRDSLRDELDKLEARLPASKRTTDPQHALRITHVRWLLDRYQ